MSELKYWTWLSSLHGLGAKNMLALLEHFGSPDAVYFADENEYKTVLECDVTPLLNKSMAAAKKIISDCDEHGISIITINDGIYPVRLKNIYDPPIVLYVKGKLPSVDDEIAIGIVGTRSCTPYGVVTAERISYEITRLGGLIVTGLAKGIDSAAAKGALRAGGKVIGVLGCGLDIVYPPSNKSLFEDVLATGAIISEFPPTTPPEGKNFPIRNRIISGLSSGVTIIEAPERSGALITASLALEQGRDVFVVPGNVDSSSCRGSNGLLREGAMAVLSGADVINTYADEFAYRKAREAETELQQLDEELAKNLVKNETDSASKRRKSTKKVIDNIPDEDYIDIVIESSTLTNKEYLILKSLDKRTHIDEIIEKTNLAAADVMSALTILEIEGAVTQDAGKFFVPHFKLVES